MPANYCQNCVELCERCTGDVYGNSCIVRVAWTAGVSLNCWSVCDMKVSFEDTSFSCGLLRVRVYLLTR
jgi:hypothetical protein